MASKKENKLAKILKVGEETEEASQKKKLTPEQIRAKINKKFGLTGTKSVITATHAKDIESIPCGVIEIDYLTGIGGFPRGRISMIYGGEGSYKSTVTLKTIAEAQRSGLIAAYVDAEHTFDKKWAKLHGVDLDSLLLQEPDTLELTLDVITEFIEMGVDIIVFDSLVAVAPKKEMYSDDKGMVIESVKKEVMGVFAKKMSQWLRAVPYRLSVNNSALVVINQLRDNISGYGNPETIPGGRAVKFFSSLIIGVKKLGGKENEGRDKQGNLLWEKFQFVTKKNKLSKGGRVGEFKTYGHIIDNYEAMLNIALKEKIVSRPSASYYAYNDKQYHGRSAIVEALMTDEDMYREIEAKVRENMKNFVASDALPTNEPDEGEVNLDDAATFEASSDEVAE